MHLGVKVPPAFHLEFAFGFQKLAPSPMVWNFLSCFPSRAPFYGRIYVVPLLWDYEPVDV